MSKEYLLRLSVVDDTKIVNMEVITNVLNKVLSASGVRILQWGEKEKMVTAMLSEKGYISNLLDKYAEDEDE